MSSASLDACGREPISDIDEQRGGIVQRGNAPNERQAPRFAARAVLRAAPRVQVSVLTVRTDTCTDSRTWAFAYQAMVLPLTFLDLPPALLVCALGSSLRQDGTRLGRSWVRISPSPGQNRQGHIQHHCTDLKSTGS